MNVTHCLGAFAKRLRSLPRAQWRGEVSAMPATCGHDCGTTCREVCVEYARMQWRIGQARDVATEHKGAKRA